MTIPFMKLTEMASEIGIRLEMIGGLPIWEVMPTLRHQSEVDRIRESIKRTGQCQCVHYADVVVEFPDGSYKRPDVTIFYTKPAELDEAVTLLPEAVIEIISQGYEKKDKEIAPQFYLENRVKDILVFDPRSLEIWHHTIRGTIEFKSPTVFLLECGCSVEI